MGQMRYVLVQCSAVGNLRALGDWIDGMDAAMLQCRA